MDSYYIELPATRRPGGFTLVEMLVVIVIMSILMTAGAIGLSSIGGKGVTSGVASAESLFDEARAVAVGQRTISRVLIAKDLTNNKAENLHRIIIANRPLKTDGTIDTSTWVLSSRATTLPDQVYFSQVYSKQTDGSAIPSDMTLSSTGAATAGTYFYYEFNSEGICTTPGASLVLGMGSRSINAAASDKPRVTASGSKDFGGFVVWRNGRTSVFRSPAQISSSISSVKPGDQF